MRHLPSDKYNVAWFRLAECVSRGEKERALGVYRLLAHSFGDEAFALQLMGDLLFAFDDSEAKEKYSQAAYMYRKDGKLLEAASLYEHLVMLDPDNIIYLAIAAELYTQMALPGKAAVYHMRLFEKFLKRDDADSAAQQIALIEPLVSLKEITVVRHNFLEFILTKKGLISDFIIEQIHQTVDGYFLSDATAEITQFLEFLARTDDFCYANACQYMASKKNE